VIRATGKEKDWHQWQQPLDVVETLVSYFSRPGEVVVDPCGGGFTTAEACLRLGRRCVSCDIDGACVEKGRQRLQEARRRMLSKTGA
jgi:site-specific DNA-methyltransferase (adenine-specific)